MCGAFATSLVMVMQMQTSLPSTTEAARFRVVAPGIREDLPAMAAQAYELATSHCGHCLNFHALWPYRRIARMCGAAESGQAEIERTMAALMASGARRVLIAAAADTGLLASVARAGASREIAITVVDRCETPLELCRRFARNWSLPVETKIADLRGFETENFDFVYANSILQFIPAERRIDVLTRLRRSLRPGGHLVLVFNTGNRIPGAILPEYRAGYTDWVLAELDCQKIQLPDSREIFRQRIDDHAREREAREGAFDDPHVVDTMIEAAGFTIERREQLDMPLAQPYQHLVTKLMKRRFLTVARSPTA